MEREEYIEKAKPIFKKWYEESSSVFSGTITDFRTIPEVMADFAMSLQPALTGWICPRCQKVHSPFSTTCDCMPTTIYATTHSVELGTNEYQSKQDGGGI